MRRESLPVTAVALILAAGAPLPAVGAERAEDRAKTPTSQPSRGDPAAEDQSSRNNWLELVAADEIKTQRHVEVHTRVVGENGEVIEEHEEYQEAEEQEKFGRPWPPPTLLYDEGMVRWLDLDTYLEPLTVPGEYRVRHYLSKDIKGQRSDIGITQHDFATGVYRMVLGPIGAGAGARVRWLDLATDASLPDGRRKFPKNLYDTELQFMFPWLMPPGLWEIKIGSASDKPFHSGDEVTADITWSIGYPNSPGYAFLFLVNYNNNREYWNRDILLGFSYRGEPEDGRFKLALGFPYSAGRVKLTEDLQLSAEYNFPRTVHLRTDYVVSKNLRFYSGFDWANQRYFLYDRANDAARLFYYEKRVAAGLRWDITENMYLDFSGGFAFDRFFFEGTRYERRNQNRLDLGDGPFVGLQFGLRF